MLGGEFTLPGGATVAATRSKNLLIRDADPSLGALGVPSSLADPKLILQSADESIIAGNHNYVAAMATVFENAGAFSFVPNAKDSALVVSLPPGSYTVTVSGIDGTTGKVIIEIYELP